jgi:S1-C subfamily serine protease
MGRVRRMPFKPSRFWAAIGVLAAAALACNAPGLSSSPSLEPIQDNTVSGQPSEQIDQSSQQPELPPSTEGQVEISPDQIAQIIPAAVQIVAVQGQGDFLQPLWTGSGTLISPNGEIVTNCHVACGAPGLVIRLTEDPDQPPVDRFFAEVTHYDEDLDLAILGITTDMSGNPVSPTDLPYLEVGNSDDLRLGDHLFIFGYPSIGGETITFTAGAVGGFESATIAGQSQRVTIKTDASIAGGNSGGTAVDSNGRLVAIPTAVNPDVREGVTIGGISILRPANLVEVVRAQEGAPPPQQQGAEAQPPESEPDVNEPNDSYEEATGPLSSGQVISGYISWQDDIDFFSINPTTTQTINVTLTGIPAGTDYDLYLLDSGRNIVAFSDSVTSQESIAYSPPAAGAYWIVVASYEGASVSQPYTLAVTFDGGDSTGGNGGGGGIVVTGRAVDANSGAPLPGGVFGILSPGVTCSQFFSSPNLDFSLVLASAETNERGFFELQGVPRGADYTSFFIYGSGYICENNWLSVPGDAIDSDLGVIEMAFN